MRRLGLTKHRNYREYWVCCACWKPFRSSNYLTAKCAKCGEVGPARIRIQRTVRSKHDSFNADSKLSQHMRKLVSAIRSELGYDKGTFPPSMPTRDFTRHVFLGPEIPRTDDWFTQVFLPRGNYSGFTKRECCTFKIAEEALAHMASATEKKMMQVRMPADLHKWLRMYAAKNDTTMTNVILSYLESLRKRQNASVKVEQI